MSKDFQLESKYSPAGDQPEAIERLVEGLNDGEAGMTLLGVTGSGKTFTIANVIEQVQRPTLILAHNKTLAAQLYGEMKDFFPHNAVEYFVSYYDYYQPEAYVPTSDTFIEKDASVNAHIEQMRLSATKALLERPDSIIVATVSAIYGLGDGEVGEALDRVGLRLARGRAAAACSHGMQRRIEFARLRLELALDRAHLNAEDLSGRAPSSSGADATGRGVQPAFPDEVVARWNELHALRTELGREDEPLHPEQALREAGAPVATVDVGGGLGATDAHAGTRTQGADPPWMQDSPPFHGPRPKAGNRSCSARGSWRRTS